MKTHAYKMNPAFVVQRIDGNMVIFDAEKSQLHTLNPTASYILTSIIKKSNTTDTLSLESRFSKKYHISLEKAQRDVTEIFNDLKKKKIILPST